MVMKLRKVLSLVLSLLLMAALPAGVLAEAAPVTLENAVVTPLQFGGNEVLVYYPQPNATDSLGISTTCTAPAFLVFGEGRFDAASADAFAKESGLAAIAAGEGASVCFVNPAEDTWSEADAPIYEMIVGAINDSSTNEVKNGISAGFDFMSGQMKSGIMATTGRIYIYATGAGADFVAAHYIRPVVSSVTYPDGFTMTFDRSATAVTVSGLTDVSGIQKNDLPVVSIGNSEEINKALTEACGTVLAADTADYAAQYAALAGKYRRQAGVLLPIHDWAAEGIKEVIAQYTVATSPDNGSAFAGTENHPVGCAIYYAEDLDVKNTKVPLVFCFHGGGNTALYEAQATEWPLIGKANGFMTVSVDLHYPNVTPTELVDLLNQLKAEYAIDETRIYASGFSMGGCKSWDLFEQYPQVFAGLAPMDATNELGQDSYGKPVENMNKDLLTPVFYVGGTESPLPEMPFQAPKCIDRVRYTFDVNKVVTAYEVTPENQAEWANPIWGISGDLTYNVTDRKAFLDSTLEVNLFASEDGKYYTALADATKMSHEVYARNSWAAWDFLSQFSRNADGSISIAEVSYALVSDDGSIADNSYNR